MATLRLAFALVVCMLVVAAPMSEAAMPCNQVAARMAPCINYLRSGGPVPPACCNGIKTLVSSARTTVDRRQACNCLKSAAGSIRGLNQGNAATLPGKCRVNIPYKISMSTNCNTVK